MSHFDLAIDDYELPADDPSLCPVCGAERERVECGQCEDGIIDGDMLMDEDPLWYGPDDWEYCSECQGKGYWWECWRCQKSERLVISG